MRPLLLWLKVERCGGRAGLAPAAGRAGLVTSAVAGLWRDTPAMKRPASLIALSMERLGMETRSLKSSRE